MSNPYEEESNGNDPYEEALKGDLVPWNKKLSDAIPEPLRVAGQIGQSLIGDFPQNIIQEPSTFMKSGPIGVQVKSGNIFNKPENDISEYVEPKTGIGKIISTVGSAIGGAVVPSIGAAKGVNKLSKAFRTGPVKKGIREIIKSGREVAYSGSKEIPELSGKYISNANKKFGEMIKDVEPSLTGEKLGELFQKVSDDLKLGSREILTSSEKSFQNIKDSIDLSGGKLSIPDIQAFIGKIRKAIPPNDHILTVFYKHLSDVLPDELKAAKEMIRPAYKVVKQAKNITRGRLSAISKGLAPRQEIEDLGNIASKIGSGAVSSASKLGEKLLSQRDILEKIKRNQKIAKWSLGLGAGSEILKKFTPSEK